jgi:hypothetical protein
MVRIANRAVMADKNHLAAAPPHPRRQAIQADHQAVGVVTQAGIRERPELHIYNDQSAGRHG